MQQRTPEWFAMRAGKFTGSRFSDLMARTKSGPAAARANLIATLAVERIIGSCVPTYQNAAMLRGIELEAEALAAYESYAGVLVEEVAFIEHPSIPNVGVSPDGFVGTVGMVEIKCPDAMAKHLAALRTGSHAREYHWQLQGQLWVTRRKWVDAVSYDPRYPEALRLCVVRVLVDAEAHQRLAEEIEIAETQIQEIIEELTNARH